MAFADLIKEIRAAKAADHTDSQGLLLWYLYNAFQVDEVEAADAICDSQNDKGIDGIWADDETQEIYLFQAKFEGREGTAVGSVDPAKFVGESAFFRSSAALSALISGKTSPQLLNLIHRQDIPDKVAAGYELKLRFVSTGRRNKDTNDYLEATNAASDTLSVVDCDDLEGILSSISVHSRVAATFAFALPNGWLDTTTPSGERVVVAPVLAREVVNMPGIVDRSLFDLNARKHAGRTRVNKELEQAIRARGQHGRFPLFHNGLTIICRSIGDPTPGFVEISDFAVVNGCQSVITLHDNQPHLSDDLRLLARLIEVGDDNALSREITYRSNNQNGISLKDLRSNDRIQVALQSEFRAEFAESIFFQIKTGETGKGKQQVISNEFAGQCLLAFYRNRAFSAHQKFRIFGDDYEDIFRGAGAWRIYLAVKMHEVSAAALGESGLPSVAHYGLTKFVFMAGLSAVLDLFPSGVQLKREPKSLLHPDEGSTVAAVERIAGILRPDFDRLIEERLSKKEGEWDFKSAFKSPSELKALTLEMKSEYEKNVRRHPEDSLETLLSRA